MDGPSKNEIAQIFKRLRSVQGNKACFDCNAKNPTWSSVTYGIFICIDCSGIHRSLGVHLTFVRSTQLDSNWTWQQLRQMQLGGNPNAAAFFRHHHCTTTDAQLKYKSRSAQLYREKLQSAAVQAIRLHGSTKLFIDAPRPEDEEEVVGDDNSEKDFFEQHVEDAAATFGNSSLTSTVDMANNKAIKNNEEEMLSGAPNVEDALSTSPTSAQQHSTRKPTIGQRKPQAKKGLGSKKKLGAQKVRKDFAEIEREAEMADQIRSKVEEDKFTTTEQDDSKISTSMRLVYQDLSAQQKKQEEKLKHTDPKKAAQVERLGMGVGSSSLSKSGVSHSLLSDMDTITQEEPCGISSNYNDNSRHSDRGFTSDFEVIDSYGEPPSSSSTFAGFSDNSSWENEFERLQLDKKAPSSSSWSNNFESDNSSRKEPRQSSSCNSSSNRPVTLNATGDEAVKKFGGAKSISSDMFFGNDANTGSDANLNRFQGSNSISSADYFNRTEVTPGSRIQSPDFEEVKDSVRQGVSKVAGRISGMASGVMSHIQEKYGY